MKPVSETPIPGKSHSIRLVGRNGGIEMVDPFRFATRDRRVSSEAYGRQRQLIQKPRSTFHRGVPFIQIFYMHELLFSNTINAYCISILISYNDAGGT